MTYEAQFKVGVDVTLMSSAAKSTPTERQSRSHVEISRSHGFTCSQLNGVSAAKFLGATLSYAARNVLSASDRLHPWRASATRQNVHEPPATIDRISVKTVPYALEGTQVQTALRIRSGWLNRHLTSRHPTFNLSTMASISPPDYYSPAFQRPQLPGTLPSLQKIYSDN